MNINQTLHRISYLKWLFFAAQVILIGYCFIVLPNNLIELIGVIIYVSGIQMGLESLSDVERISEKEIHRFQNPKYAIRLIRMVLFGVAVLMTISLLFLSLKFVFPTASSSIFQELFNLGLDCWALILGFLFLLKSIKDKQHFAQSKCP